MKRNVLAIILLLFLVGCSSSSDNFKVTEDMKVLKNGTISWSNEVVASGELPLKHYKLFFDKSGKVVRHDYLNSGKVKRYAKYTYNNSGKIIAADHYEDGKYNGVSKYLYGSDGNIEKEMLYDRDLNFLFSKKIGDDS